MKKEEVDVPYHTIVLGIFKEPIFKYFASRGALQYDEFWMFDSIYAHNDGIVDTVEKAAKWAKKVIFVLDGVRFPIDAKRSITCAELKRICEDDDLFEKTVFVKGDNVIDFDKNLI